MNNTFINYVYDARNRLLSAGGLNYAYDCMVGNKSLQSTTQRPEPNAKYKDGFYPESPYWAACSI
jgi:hypothetical protein